MGFLDIQDFQSEQTVKQILNKGYPEMATVTEQALQSHRIKVK